MITNAVIVGDNIPPEQYNTETEPRGSKALVVRSHILSEVLRNAQRWQRGYESPESKAKEWGNLYDCLLLVPFQFHRRYALLPADAPRKPTKAQINAKKPSAATLEAIEWWDAFLEDNPGEIIKPELNASVHAAINRLREDKLISELLECSKRQVMIVAEWHDKATGLVVPIKCLIDLVPAPDHPVFANSIWDSKSTRNAAPRAFSRDAQKFWYHGQGGFYLDMYNAASGENRSDFGHVVQESFPPYEYRTPPPLLTQRFLDFGKLSYQVAMSIYCKALATGEWPSYDQRNSKSWPMTDCDDRFLSLESLFPPLDEEDDDPEEEEALEAPQEETADLIP